MDPLIYLDNNATTALDQEVLEAMMPYFTTRYANASSTLHRAGKLAAQGVEQARENLADLLHCQARELYFTSGATEAVNWAIRGAYERSKSFRRHIIVGATEHKAVLDTCRYLEKQGAELTYLPVQETGTVDPLVLKAALREDTFMVALMYANNETGVIHPVDEIAKVLQGHAALWFCDATQAAGKIPIDLQLLPVDMLCVSAHKFYGPKGAGALYIRRGARSMPVEPLFSGGGQEHGLRAGTLNVPGIVGLGAAAKIAAEKMSGDQIRIQSLRDFLEGQFLDLPETYVQGNLAPRLYTTLNITFRYVRAEQLIAALRHVAVSTGSACTTGSLTPSHVLSAMGQSAEDAKSSLRISLGRFNTLKEVKMAAAEISGKVRDLRAGDPVWKMFLEGHIS